MSAPNARILALLELVDEAPSAQELEPYLKSDDPEVRRTALTVLSEAGDDWAEAAPYFAAALTDPDDAVRRRAADLLRELREVLRPGPEFIAHLQVAASSADAGMRCAAIGALWRHRLTSPADLLRSLSDPDPRVRREVVLGFVSLDDLDGLAAAAGDPEPRIRIAAARGVGAVGDPRGIATLVRMHDDSDHLVRAAALNALSETGCTDDTVGLAVAGLSDAAWEVRQAAATALIESMAEGAVEPLIAAAADQNLDVRKAAVKALTPRLAENPDVREALLRAQGDADADVRAFARIALEAETGFPT
ncbi:HEAT repeat domain-containing protein [Promicromonospora panici]|uniref:HEAT repeat domain-containing protein n=1 Tax=Promicromonospora panici TaxID=2219658 RepID=UPI001A91091D|nr:HEAT repeat domain-containing protein [Promicromonospora panici]